MTRVRDIAKAIESWAPKGSALSYDNVGLQVGEQQAEVTKALVALDLTPEVLQEAIDEGCQLIITHHPILFKPLKNIVGDSYISRLVLEAAKNSISIYTGHTNVDAARGGVSFLLGEELGLENLQFLSPLEGSLIKLVTFAPLENEDAVRQALADAGAGQIGHYDSCSFSSHGAGRFKAGEGSNPSIGSIGSTEKVEESRIEVQCHSWDLTKIVSALKEVHPYEEVAYDIYPTSNDSTNFGLGCIGDLGKAMPVSAFLEHCKESLGLDALRYSTAHEGQELKRIAVCGGSGGSLIAQAKRAGADALVTADITYHTYFETFDAQGKSELLLVDIGHYESEVFIEKHFIDRLSSQFKNVAWMRTTHVTNPMHHI